VHNRKSYMLVEREKTFHSEYSKRIMRHVYTQLQRNTADAPVHMNTEKNVLCHCLKLNHQTMEQGLGVGIGIGLALKV